MNSFSYSYFLDSFLSAQSAKLLTSFREFKRREGIGLSPLYSHKLAALEEALLGQRERLWAMQDSAAAAAAAVITDAAAEGSGGGAAAAAAGMIAFDAMLVVARGLGRVEREVGCESCFRLMLSDAVSSPSSVKRCRFRVEQTLRLCGQDCWFSLWLPFEKTLKHVWENTCRKHFGVWTLEGQKVSDETVSMITFEIRCF